VNETEQLVGVGGMVQSVFDSHLPHCEVALDQVHQVRGEEDLFLLVKMAFRYAPARLVVIIVGK